MGDKREDLDLGFAEEGGLGGKVRIIRARYLSPSTSRKISGGQPGTGGMGFQGVEGSEKGGMSSIIYIDVEVGEDRLRDS